MTKTEIKRISTKIVNYKRLGLNVIDIMSLLRAQGFNINYRLAQKLYNEA